LHGLLNSVGRYLDRDFHLSVFEIFGFNFQDA